MQIANQLAFTALRDFLRITTTRHSRNSITLWKGSDSCGKPHRTRLRSASQAPWVPREVLWCPRSLAFEDREDMQATNPHGFEIIPRSVSPFTKNCIASATSSNPMILTRMRMPVSPSTVRIRPAPASTK